MRFFRLLLLVVLVPLLSPDLSAFWPVAPSKPPEEDECRLVRKNRHRPKVCSRGSCEKCTNATCAKAKCGQTKR